MSGSTWVWNGGTGQATISANWALVAGPGNAFGYPQAGDTAINAGGTVLTALDTQFNSNIIELGGTAAIAALSMMGDSGMNFANPTFAGTTVLSSSVAGNSTAESSVLDAAGSLVNKGTILADGPAGSSFTIAISGTTINGTYQPGYFINYGTIIADAGNAMTIAIAGTSELFNTGEIIANGGSLFIDAASNAIAGGYAPVVGMALIEGGGTIETNQTYAGTISGTAPEFIFGDSTTGDTLKIDNAAQFGARIVDFAQGDTIDLGTSLAVGIIAFTGTTGILELENNAGGTLASLVLASGSYASGTFFVSSGSADGFTLTTGADGDTLLTTDVQNAAWIGGSGTWQTASDWSTDSVPGLSDTPVIGMGSSSTLVVTTGSTSVSTTSLTLADPNALLQITSATSITSYGIQQVAGTMEVTSGNTLSTSFLRQYTAGTYLLLDPGSVLDITGHLNIGFASNGTVSIASGDTAGPLFAGTVLVNGGTLNAGPTQTVSGATGGFLAIGYDNAGAPATVTVQDGGTVSDTYSILSSDPTSFGVLTLTGSGTTWTDAGDPSDPQDSRGYMLIGYNDEASNTPAGVTATPYVAAAQLTVENGATLTEASRAYIGDTTDSAGTVTVTTGGLWDVAYATGGFLVVGWAGQGALIVSGGGTVEVGNSGTYRTNGKTASAGGIGIGYGGTSGSITVESGGLLLDAGGIGIGKGEQGQGTLDVVNGGTVVVTGNGIGDGVSAGSTGTVVVSGTASVVTLGTASTGISVGESGQGNFQILNGGTVSYLSDDSLSVGGNTGVSGTLLVSGAGALLTLGIATGGITVGNAGAGTLQVENGGTVTTSGRGLLVGEGAGGGTVLVSGTGSAIDIFGSAVAEAGDTFLFTLGSLLVGASGAGILDVSDGGTLDLPTGLMFVGQNSGVNGTVVVSGTNSLLTVGSTAIPQVGISGQGTLDVLSGGTVAIGYNGAIGVSNANPTVTSFIIGENHGSTGSVTVSGSGALLASADPVHVGQGGQGVLDVTDGGNFMITDPSYRYWYRHRHRRRQHRD